MIIQRVIKGIGGSITRSEAERLLQQGITCNWWRNVDPLPNPKIPQRLTDRNLFWHQNRYSDPDPLEGGQPFYEHTPFIQQLRGLLSVTRA